MSCWMIDYYPQDPRYYLQNELRERLKRRPLYSLRALARDLDVSVSSLSGFLNNQTSFSSQRILELAKKIKLSTDHTEHWLDLISWKFSKSADLKKVAGIRIEVRIKSSRKLIGLESFKFIARWEALALLELFGFEKKFTEAEMSKYLGIKKAELQSLTQTLLRLNLIAWNNDRWRPVEEDSFVGQELPSQAIRQFHSGILKKAAQALKDEDLTQREFRSTVFSMRRQDLPRLKQDLSHFWMEQIGKYARPSKNDSIFCFSMQLFDLMNEEIDYV